MPKSNQKEMNWNRSLEMKISTAGFSRSPNEGLTELWH